MTPLDLTRTPPRSPWEQVHGLYLMARTIDKLRATLPGGNLGAYRIRGFSEQLLQKLGVTEEQLRQIVAKALTDDDIARWLDANTDLSAYDAINAFFAGQTIAGRSNRAEYNARYPVAVDLPDSTPLFDVLVRDDRAAFAGM